MTLLEKIKARWRPHFRHVKIYTHLQELIADLYAAGLSQRANEVEKTLIAGAFADELLEEETILLRNIVKEEKLPPKTFVLSRRSDAMKARAWQEIANLDGQLMNYILLRDLRGIEALELKWRQYPAQWKREFCCCY